MSDRLLTEEELQEILEIGGTINDYATEIMIKQDTKTYSIAYKKGQRDARKEAGEWIKKNLGEAISKLELDDEIATFLQGVMPKEMEEKNG